MNDLKRLLGYMGPYRRDMALGMLLVVIESSFEMVIPILMSDIIDVGVARGDVGEILRTGVEMAVCAVLALVTGLLYARYAARASSGPASGRPSTPGCSSTPSATSTISRLPPSSPG